MGGEELVELPALSLFRITAALLELGGMLS